MSMKTLSLWIKVNIQLKNILYLSIDKIKQRVYNVFIVKGKGKHFSLKCSI